MKNMGIAMIYGVIAILVVVLGSSLIFSLLLKFTTLQESSLTWVILILSFLALFIGGFVSGGKGKEKGWLMGGATGLLYILIVFLFNFLGFDSTFSTEQFFYHTGFLATAMIGGIIGVNVTTPARNT